jgi:catechol 2,3-dioxygenase-like lactoylglutathione lyase family enzyme
VVRIKAVLVAIAIVVVSLSLSLNAQSTSMRPPITGITKVSVYATDLAKSKQFYETFLGFPQITSNSGSSPMEFRVSSKQSIEVQPAPAATTDFLAYIAFATSDIDSMRRYLVSQKVPLEGEIQSQADGTRFLWVKDPEGHRLQFVQLPPHGHLVPVGAAASKNAPQPISQLILHAGFIVQNRAEEDRFFHDILGFVEGWQGGRGHKLEWVDMRVPDGTEWLEYMLQDPGAKTAGDSGVLNHFALGVPDIHQAAQMLQQRHWDSSNPFEDPEIGLDGKWQLNLYDPNGTRAELMEFGPVRKPCCSPYTLPTPK